MGRTVRPSAVATILLLLALLVAGCLPAGDEGGAAAANGPGDDGESEATSDDPSGETLVVWDQWTRAVESDVVDTLNAEFEAEHGVTIQRETKTLDDLKRTIGLAMGQSEGPDVSQVNQGRADMGALVEAGLLMDLTTVAEERGWTERFSENLLNRNMFTEDGAQFGTGNLYGVAPQAEIVGWYYNRAKMDELGLEVPTTFAELETLLADIAAAGETPITFGNLDPWPAIHTYGAIEHTMVDVDYLNELVFGLGDASFAIPENVEAAEILQGWVEAGYFTEDFSGIGYDDSWAQFAAGEGALMLTGSWIAGEFDQEQVGFFLTPGEEPGSLPPQTGGMGVPYGIRADTEAPELAREYVAWMTGEEAAQAWVEAWLPSRPPAPDAVESPLMTDLVTAWDRVLESEQLGHYLDWASPTIYDALTSQLQQLLADQKEPQPFVEALQEEYAESIPQGSQG